MARRTLNDDLFFFHRDRKAVEWLYHNPDSNTGGQFEKIFIPYDELLHTFSVDLSIKTSQEFFVYSLSSDNIGYLIDKGTPEYEAEIKKPFEKEEEYQQKSARLEELTNLLSINKDEHDDIDVEGIEVNPNERNII